MEYIAVAGDHPKRDQACGVGICDEAGENYTGGRTGAGAERSKGVRMRESG